MRILLMTQDDPFYLAENLDFLINQIPTHSEIVGAFVSNVSPFGKKGTMLEKAKITYDIFGLRFFLRYTSKYLLNKCNYRKSIKKNFSKTQYPNIKYTGQY